MRYLWMTLLVTLALSGCMEVPSAWRPPTPGPHASAVLDLKVASPPREIQAPVHRWVTSDVHQFKVTLKVWNGSAYVDLAPANVLIVSPQLHPGKQARYSNLKANQKYRAVVEAFGNVGGTSPTFHLNSQTPAFADFDFTGGPNLEDTLATSVQVTLDPVPFSGVVTLRPVSIPNMTNNFLYELRDTNTNTVKLTGTFMRNQTMTLNNLRMGIPYQVTLTARQGNGSVIATRQSPVILFDPLGQDVEQARQIDVSFN